MKLIAVSFTLVAIWWLIVFKLVHLGHMKTLLLLLTLLAWQCDPLAAQTANVPDGAIIRAAAISGLDARRLSPGLNRDIDALVGKPLDHAELTTLAGRIESEQPNLLVAVRSVPIDGGEARVVFLIAPVPDNPAGPASREDNVNTRYIVERVVFDGIEEERLSPELRADLQAVVGTRLSARDAERLIRRVRTELPGYVVSRRMSRGSERGRLRMTLQVRPGEAMRWLHYAPNRSKGLYHVDQGWSGLLDANIGSRDWRVAPLLAWSNADDLVEEYDGFGVRVAARRVGSERVGFALELSRFYADWAPPTIVAAEGTSALLYKTRSTVSPTVRFAISPQWNVSGGVSVTQLTADEGNPEGNHASNVYMLGVNHASAWTSGAIRQGLTATLDIRSGAPSLGTEFEFTRLSGRVDYSARWRHDALLTSFSAGRVNGGAPLFERFTLGDSTTLRGWNKQVIIPLGGDRTYHGSIEYRHHGLAAFLDGGSVWESSAVSQVRFSTGVGFHNDGFFATLAFPLNTSDVRTVFMSGVRF